jgi:hypothetical protein
VYNDYAVPIWFDFAVQENDGEPANYSRATLMGRKRVGSGDTLTFSASVPKCKSKFYTWVGRVRFTDDDSGPVAIP